MRNNFLDITLRVNKMLHAYRAVGKLWGHDLTGMCGLGAYYCWALSGGKMRPVVNEGGGHAFCVVRGTIYDPTSEQFGDLPMKIAIRRVKKTQGFWRFDPANTVHDFLYTVGGWPEEQDPTSPLNSQHTLYVHHLCLFDAEPPQRLIKT